MSRHYRQQRKRHRAAWRRFTRVLRMRVKVRLSGAISSIRICGSIFAP
jgi:hypothetical protein